MNLKSFECLFERCEWVCVEIQQKCLKFHWKFIYLEDHAETPPTTILNIFFLRQKNNIFFLFVFHDFFLLLKGTHIPKLKTGFLLRHLKRASFNFFPFCFFFCKFLLWNLYIIFFLNINHVDASLRYKILLKVQLYVNYFYVVATTTKWTKSSKTKRYISKKNALWNEYKELLCR